MIRVSCAAIALFAGCAAYSQTFEVVSIKPAPPPDGRGMRVGSNGGPGSKDPGRWTAENNSIANLITQAYDLKRYQFNGQPWMDQERFDINAKVPEGATKEQFKVMLQNMLIERFGLKFHYEKKDMAGFDLVVAKNGPKLKESVEVPPAESDGVGGGRSGNFLSGPPKLDADGFPELPPGQGSMMISMNGRARSRQVKNTSTQIANMLANQVGKPVTDATGLTGKYDYTLSWSNGGPVRLGGGEGGAGAGGALPSMPEQDTGPTIYTAVQEQLGLKLEQKKVTVNVLVVDHVEKTPTEN